MNCPAPYCFTFRKDRSLLKVNAFPFHSKQIHRNKRKVYKAIEFGDGKKAIWGEDRAEAVPKPRG